jgi:hypothetical protein
VRLPFDDTASNRYPHRRRGTDDHMTELRECESDTIPYWIVPPDIPDRLGAEARLDRFA